MDKMAIEELKKQFEIDLENVKSSGDLAAVFNKYLSKETGLVTKILRGLKDLSAEEKVAIGGLANNLNKQIRQALFEKENSLKAGQISVKKIDVTVPVKKRIKGHIHPLSRVLKQAQEIFEQMGFAIVDGPEIETPWYNFDALNIPKDHPARDKWDTFWLKDKSIKGEPLLLRTHTSPMQVRYMESHNPPLRIIVPGKVFRHEATDASHEFDICQIEGLMIGENISVANLKTVILEFLKKFFGREVKIRLRPSFFPFTEPSFEVDMSCLTCGGKGCPVCKQNGWVEIMGAGMVHPNVFNSAKLDLRQWQGFAFGMGADRLAMMKYKINDIRLFRQNDARFLEQF
ncbi:MAG: phenylalanine--tRNA ligase subunit alpha [Candidatus Paceibacterota bacterium]